MNRTAKRGLYSRSVIDAVLDEAFYAHVGFVVDEQPYVIPMVYGRDGEQLYLHGSVASRQLRTLSKGHPVCVTVTNMRALVLARSALNLSVNYQSAVIIGEAESVSDPETKLAALERIAEHVIPGSWENLRPPSDKELRSVSVLRLNIEEASAKVRQDPPFEEPGDEKLPAWGGLIPVNLTFGPPIPDEWAHIRPPSYVWEYKRSVAPPLSGEAFQQQQDETPL